MSSRLLEPLAEQRVDWSIFGFLDERSYSLFIAASSSASGNADRRREPEAEPRPEVRTAAKARPAAPPSPERPPPQPVALRVPRYPPPLQVLTLQVLSWRADWIDRPFCWICSSLRVLPIRRDLLLHRLFVWVVLRALLAARDFLAACDCCCCHRWRSEEGCWLRGA